MSAHKGPTRKRVKVIPPPERHHCAGLDLVAGRAKPSDTQGLIWDLNMIDGLYYLNLYMRRGKKEEGPLFRASFAKVNFCPFCGAKIEQGCE